ncbi:hypothetical protein [Halovulum marinum]|nr:hypothetical protein [Halovulum marinum]
MKEVIDDLARPNDGAAYAVTGIVLWKVLKYVVIVAVGIFAGSLIFA